MHASRLALAAAIAFAATSSAQAACLPEGPPAQAFTPKDATQRTANLVVMAATLSLLDAFAPKALRGIKTTCEAATLQSGKAAYAVRGTGDQALPRIMISNDRKAPLLFLMTVPDITGVLPKTDPATPLGYALAARDDKAAYVYRAYAGIPPDVQLATDVAAVLENRVPAMLRADLATKQVHISMAPGAGEVADRPPAPAAAR